MGQQWGNRRRIGRIRDRFRDARPDRIVNPCRRFDLERLRCVQVYVRGDGDRRVPHARAHRLEVDAALERERAIGVAQIVESYADAGALRKARKALRERLEIERPSKSVREHRGVIDVAETELELLLPLREPMRAEQIDE